MTAIPTKVRFSATLGAVSVVLCFGILTFEDCLFGEGYQWQMGLRGVAGK